MSHMLTDSEREVLSRIVRPLSGTVRESDTGELTVAFPYQDLSFLSTFVIDVADVNRALAEHLKMCWWDTDGAQSVVVFPEVTFDSEDSWDDDECDLFYDESESEDNDDEY